MSKKGIDIALMKELCESMSQEKSARAMLTTAGTAIGMYEGPVGAMVGAAVGSLAGLIIDNFILGDSQAVIEAERRKVQMYEKQLEEANRANDESMQQIKALMETLNAQLKDQQAKFNEIKQRYHGIMAKPSDAEMKEKMSELGFLDDHFHIAVAGTSGVGKSAFVNAIRGIRDGGDSAAAVGYTETTLTITRYAPSGSEQKVVWFDVPGAGTARVDRWEYFKEQGLYVMDAIILIWADRILDTDQNIIENCAALGIPCFLVRSKCDMVVKDLQIQVAARMSSVDMRSPEFKSALSQELEAFKQRNLDCATASIRRAHQAVNVPLSIKDVGRCVFRINNRSMRQIVTQKIRDEYTLDEEALVISLAMAMATPGSFTLQ